MSTITKELMHYPEMVEFIVNEFRRPIEDVIGLSWSQDVSTYLDEHSIRRSFPLNQRLTVRFADGTEETAFLNGKRFSYVAELPEESEETNE